MRLAFTGDREYRPDYFVPIYAILESLHSDDYVILGDAKGVDSIAAWMVQEIFKLPHVVYEADWRTYGKSAGPIRNKVMLDDKPEVLYAIHVNFERSKGTRNCVEQARKMGIKVVFPLGTL